MLASLLTLTFLGVLVIVLPSMAWTSRRQLALLRDVPRGAFYAQALLVQFLLGGFAFVVARADRIVLPFTAPAANHLDELKLAITLLLGAIALLLFGFRHTSASQRTVLRLLAPRAFNERVSWVMLSLVVAFVEEITYRAVLPAIVSSAVPNLIVVVIVCSLVFGAAHLLQGVESAILAASVGAGLHLLVLTGDRLNSAIVVHFLYDVTAGFYLGRKFLEEEPAETA